MSETTRPPNILLVVLDSARARNFGIYGHDRETTPFLSEFEKESVKFTSAWSPGVWTLPSHVSMLSGYDVAEHGVTSTEDSINPQETVFHKLSERGYDTGVFSENTWLTEAEVGLKHSFDTVRGKPSVIYPSGLNPGEFAHRNEYGDYLAFIRESLSHDAPLKSLLNGVAAKVQYDFPERVSNWLLAEPTGEYYVDSFLKWSRDSSGPWAGCINLMDAHRPYVPSADMDLWSDSTAWEVQKSLSDPVWPFLREDEPLWKLRELEDLYDGGIRQCDHAIKRLIHGLKERDALEDTFVIITGDHGEGFGEDSFLRPDEPVVEHKAGIHPVQTNVPLLVRTPSKQSGSVTNPVSLTRIHDVILSMVSEDFEPTDFSAETGARISYTGGAAQQIDSQTDGEEPTANCVVQQIGDKVVKLTEWGDSEASVSIEDAQVATPNDEYEIEPRVSAAFSTLRTPDIREDRTEPIEPGVKDRLEELGYR
ncbi:sulfatase-like hydrolase/transferase [Halobacterium litoreum]|uniref:Sulfatase-like hydrolase/transferase n=1 Tax=Halobacterium litoreum TaxID=2039234 RepID=A0ABD5NAM9_9EURY|nr:sulfatase-like hydrolase/transferase [Halobacterium litoreum]UHH14732.1 sulfatase-like hydrolase/transferase [Halobacterium litoreum]